MFWSLRGSSLAGLCLVDESAQITLFPPSQEKLRVILISSALCSPYLPPAATLGTLDFSLLYDQENNALHCTINKAKVSRRRRRCADANDDVSAPSTDVSFWRGFTWGFTVSLFFIQYVSIYYIHFATAAVTLSKDTHAHTR